MEGGGGGGVELAFDGTSAVDKQMPWSIANSVSWREETKVRCEF